MGGGCHNSIIDHERWGEFIRGMKGVDADLLDDMKTLGEVFDKTLRGFDDLTQKITGLSESRFYTMEALFFHPDQCLTPGEISALLRLPRQTVTWVIDGLESRGFVERGAHQTDRRKVVVNLTATGEEWTRAALPAVYKMGAEILGKLMPAVRQAMVAGMTEVAREVDRHLEGDNGS